ncbi:alpha/beta hydrolase family protein [Streptomyces bambusae]|uniref:alpha/beta hydrolase family protein n=1 Tax=Streptomyces bambusae TaxID=1550616 RepID=UPI0040402E9E
MPLSAAQLSAAPQSAASLSVAVPTAAASSGTVSSALSGTPSGATPAAQGAPLELPRPTGRLAVGRDTLHLVDRTRKDPWVPTADRELMLSLYYPARPHTGSSPAPYVTLPEAQATVAAWKVGDLVTPERFAALRTSAREGARPQPGRFPLVVLSPGFGMPRATLTALAEELASRGYVVAAVDHAYESVGASFPGGRLLACVACDKAAEDKQYQRVSDGRARDVSFVLDRLTGPKPAWRYAHLVDSRRIGMAGHSIGGASAAAAMATDRRVDAGVNMDGTFFSPIPEGGLKGRPFLMLGGDPALRPPGESSWEAAWQRLDGWKRWLTVTGTGHMAFTDLLPLGDAIGRPDPHSPLSGTRSVEITRAYVTAFFDQHLRGLPQPLLTGPSAANPEVVFHP